MNDVFNQYEVPYIKDQNGAFIQQGSNSIVNNGNVQSANYSANGSTGYNLSPTGDATFNNLVAKGKITVSAGGVIGGFDIGDDYLRDTANSFGLASTVSGGDDIRLWAGSTFANRATAPFNVSESGVLKSILGNIGGWTIATNDLTGGKVKLDATNERILVGDATAPLTGNGVFMGKDGSVYKFRAGDPAGKYILFDGTTGFTMNGIYLSQATLASLASGSALEIQNWNFNGVFSATDNDTVAWTSGTLTLADGTTYSISAGNTGNMSAITYIYFSLSASTTVLQTSTTASNAVGAGKVLICTAQNVVSGKNAEFQVFGGNGGISKLITASNIAAGTITSDEIATNTITANKMNVSTLASISADIGTITAGNMTINSSGFIKGGQTSFNNGTGFFLGYEGGAYKFSIGNPSDNYLYYDGSKLSGRANIEVYDTLTAGEDITAGNSLQLGFNTSSTYYPSADTYARENDPTTNYGGLGYITTQSGYAGQKYRIFMNWDLSKVPAHNLLSATMYLYLDSAPSNIDLLLEVYRVTQSWAENSLTWNNQPSYNNSMTSGSYTSQHFNNGESGWHAIPLDLTEFNKWLNGTYSNYGMMLYFDILYATNFHSKENATNKPYLLLSYDNSKVFKATADYTSSNTSTWVGMALNTVSYDQGVDTQFSNTFTTSGLTAGSVYYQSNTRGAISTTPGTNTKKIGLALSTTKILMLNS